MARVTERVRLGPAALNPFTLHPYEIAGQTAMLDLVSGGRAYLGLVKGAWLDRLGLEDGRPLLALQEAVEIVRKLLAGDTSGVRGRAVHARARARRSRTSRVRPTVPLLVGTWGERTAAWAGTVADEIKVGGSANPDLVPVVRGWVGGAARCGSSWAASPSWTRTARWARERARAAVAPYLDVVARPRPDARAAAGRGATARPLRDRRDAGGGGRPRGRRCGTPASTASSSERRRGARRRRASG